MSNQLTDNSLAIITLCSHLGKEEIQPLEPREWGLLAQNLNDKKLEPKDILCFSLDDLKEKLGLSEDVAKRVYGLASRSGNIAFELKKLDELGIGIITRADENYPKRIKRYIGYNAPPLFYYSGDLNIANKVRCLGMVGSRTVTDKDIEFTKLMAKKATSKSLGIVTGGAKGVDTIASKESFLNGGISIEILADSMMTKIKDKDYVKAIRNGNLLLLSVAKPNAGFNVGMAMQRNKYIYALSEATLVVKSDLDKGGTWAGAIDNLKTKVTDAFIWNNTKYPGNKELIKRGLLPIDENWDMNVKKIEKIVEKKIENKVEEKPLEQISLFNI